MVLNNMILPNISDQHQKIINKICDTSDYVDWIGQVCIVRTCVEFHIGCLLGRIGNNKWLWGPQL